MLIGPLNALPWVMGGLYSSKISTKRISNYLKQENITKGQTNKVTNNLAQDSIVLAYDIKEALWPVPANIDPKVNKKAPKSKKLEPTAPAHDPEYPIFSLKNIKIQLMKGQLVMVIGPTGSGKTALLNALSGEMDLKLVTETLRSSESKICLVPQNRWI